MNAIIAEIEEKLTYCVGEEKEEWLEEKIYAGVLEKAKSQLLELKDKLKLGKVEEACKGFRVERKGREATYKIGQLLRMVIAKYMCRLSYRGCEERVRSDLVLRWFCGYKLLEEVCDASTLCRFEKYMRENCPEEVFKEVLRQIGEEMGGKKKLQVGDTFAVEANAARQSVTKLLREGSKKLLEAMGEVDMWKTVTVQIKVEMGWLFGEPEEKPVSYGENAEEVNRRLRQCVKGVMQLLKGVKEAWSPLPITLEVWVERLEKVLADEVTLWVKAEKREQEEVKEAEIIELEVKRRRKKGSYRIGSMTDPEATYRNHDGDVTFGYNVSIAADEDGFVQAVYTATGSEPDSEGVVPLLTQQDEPPEQLVYDQAAGRGKHFFEVDHATDGKTELIAQPVDYAKRRGMSIRLCK